MASSSHQQKDIFKDGETEEERKTSKQTPPMTPREAQRLQEVYNHVYEEGDVGKMQAIIDVQQIFDELHGANLLEEKVNLLPPAGECHPHHNQYYQQKPPLPSSPNPLSLFRNNKSSKASFAKPHLSDQDFLSKRSSHQSMRSHGKTPSLPLLPSNKKTLMKTEGHKESQNDAEDKEKEDKPEVRVISKAEAFSIVSKHMMDLDGMSEEDESDLIQENTYKGDLSKLHHFKRSPSGQTSNKLPIPNDQGMFRIKYRQPVYAHETSLHRILSPLHNLVCLVLDDSELESLRDLGSSLPSLITLSVVNCRLPTLDGAAALPNLRTLVAQNNRLEHVTPLTFCSQLAYLDISFNPIKNIEPFTFLKVCEKLKCIKMEGTPVSSDHTFRNKIKKLIPFLKEVSFKKVKTIPFAQSSPRKDPLQELLRQQSEIIYDKNVNEGAGGDIVIDDDLFEKLLKKSVRNPGASDVEGGSSGGEMYFSADSNSEMEDASSG